MKYLLEIHSVSVVFHAAAYKHVPLVEVNPLSGLSNNVFQRIQFVGHVFLPLLISSFSFHPTKLSDQPM